ncbi:MAG TPA: carboxypeptidase regulatory-like domain-containing protein [Thermoanaerobaculia bacterium]|nr:carboxypeptidase regulatory-like domain-containing protein [Thermoanaerobaculia bacterium]
MIWKRIATLLLIPALPAMLACGGGGETAAYTYEDEDGQARAASDTGAPAQAAPAVADAATVIGAVRLNGTPPPAPAIQMAADPACHAVHQTPVRSEEVVAGPGGELANVFVYVKDYAGAAPRPTAPALLDQKGCQYIPHVSGVQVGQTIQIRNSDPTLHNVHALPKVNREFNIGQPVQGMVSEKVFDRPEVMVRIKCDVHNWMNSYMGVLPHPYFGTSDTQGAFRIANLPPGTYTLEAWHEKYGTQTQQLTVGPNEQKEVSFTFDAS